mgnify:FL=1
MIPWDLLAAREWLYATFPGEEGRLVLAFLVGAVSMAAVLGLRR